MQNGLHDDSNFEQLPLPPRNYYVNQVVEYDEIGNPVQVRQREALNKERKVNNSVVSFAAAALIALAVVGYMLFKKLDAIETYAVVIMNELAKLEGQKK